MSEYISRLRQELVDAAARERAGRRRRPGVRPRRLVPVLAAAVVAVSAVLAVQAINVADDRPVGDLPLASALTYRAAPAPGADAANAAERSADVLRTRIAAAGIDGATVSVVGDRIGVDVAAADRARVAALAVPGRLAIYDWETSVLGPHGRPSPGDESVTGGPGAGQAGAVPRSEAESRAAKAQDTGGVRVVRAEGAADGWYALGAGAALDNADVADASAARDPAHGDPIVAFDFTAKGRAAFSALTREIARRGADAAKPGQAPMQAWQHLAMVLDDRLVSVPFIDFQRAPDGIDGARGAQIQGGLSAERARLIATILDTGPMPATLIPASP